MTVFSRISSSLSKLKGFQDRLMRRTLSEPYMLFTDALSSSLEDKDAPRFSSVVAFSKNFTPQSEEMVVVGGSQRQAQQEARSTVCRPKIHHFFCRFQRKEAFLFISSCRKKVPIITCCNHHHRKVQCVKEVGQSITIGF